MHYRDKEIEVNVKVDTDCIFGPFPARVRSSSGGLAQCLGFGVPASHTSDGPAHSSQPPSAPCSACSHTDNTTSKMLHASSADSQKQGNLLLVNISRVHYCHPEYIFDLGVH